MSVASVPAAAEGPAVFVRLVTRTDTTDTESSAGPFPLTLATAEEVSVVTTDGKLWDGESLTVEVRRCVAECATSEVVGRATVEPDGWTGTSRSVAAGEVPVTLPYLKTTS